MEFQKLNARFIVECFGAQSSQNIARRNHRFLEEALELVQSKGCTASEAHRIVDYVYGRPVGQPYQEVGGVMVTLGALCSAIGVNMEQAGEDELIRCWSMIEQIRKKSAAKPEFST